MKYEKLHAHHNFALTLILAAFVLGALLIFDHLKPEYAGIMSRASSNTVSIAE